MEEAEEEEEVAAAAARRRVVVVDVCAADIGGDADAEDCSLSCAETRWYVD